VRARLQQELRERIGEQEWRMTVISECDVRPEVLGLSVSEIAAMEGVAPLDAALDLIADSEGQVGCVRHGQSEVVVRALMQLPFVVPGSDGYSLSPEGVLGRRKPHPRSYGTFPRVLGKYVRDEGVLTLAEAVRKMSAVPAERLGLTDRGIIQEGARADIVVFNADTVADEATFADPHRYPTGIPYVVVNGQIVIDDGVHTGALPGQVL
jgi:N-acyl-D-amino-acid deacylase